jgi:hypothetical protein
MTTALAEGPFPDRFLDQVLPVGTAVTEKVYAVTDQFRPSADGVLRIFRIEREMHPSLSYVAGFWWDMSAVSMSGLPNYGREKLHRREIIAQYDTSLQAEAVVAELLVSGWTWPAMSVRPSAPTVRPSSCATICFAPG